MVWSWILDLFKANLRGFSAICIYLVTNIAKYIPGNVWHFLGRVRAIEKKGDSLDLATVAVVIEPFLMAIAAALMTVVAFVFAEIENESWLLIWLIVTGIVAVCLMGINPKVINFILEKTKKISGKCCEKQLVKYPLKPLVGGIVFLILRGMAFTVLLMAFIPLKTSIVPVVIMAFSMAWLLGLIIPGAPGGLGVFEAVALAILEGKLLSSEKVIIVVAFFRVSSILAETIMAYLAWLLNPDI
ncbi:MAG: UPF0104 family protein [Geminocystis sp.]|nr:UPF0104 family protein [Geminocystis sp.]MCX8078724.1 UPF0104 family protein [Geminocystis sp.]